MKGKILEFETMGMADGPGMRLVVFMLGCRLRCIYCHNPETWKIDGSFQEVSSEDVLQMYKKYSAYYGETGGVTFSGGEPLLQKEFVLETIKLLKENGIHVALDTAGVADDYDEILSLVDLVILDVKAVDADEYQRITGASIEKFNEFLDVCKAQNKKMWLRQVIVPGINDDEEHILKLKHFAETIPNVERIELLPYRSMAVQKYKEMGLPYVLEGTPDLTKEDIKVLEELLKRV